VLKRDVKLQLTANPVKSCSGYIYGFSFGDLTQPRVTLDTHTHNLLRPFSRTTQLSLCQKKSSGLYGAREDNRGRHTDNPAGYHSIQTNQRPTCIIPPFLRRMPFLLHTSQFILAWDRHQICWLAYPVEKKVSETKTESGCSTSMNVVLSY